MKINEENKLIIDEKNSYIHTEGKLLSIMNRDDFIQLKDHDNDKYSIKLFLVRKGKVETKLIKYYKINGFLGFDVLEQICSPKSTTISLDIDKRMTAKNGTVILSYEGIVDCITEDNWDK
ncbi:MAG: hypothetical protein LBM26_04200 [Methanobrevibacter sp.]|jgi:hypothetical protein|nr:hypothetical protein [Methanobrevibacter sp.]